MTPEQIYLVQTSWRRVFPHAIKIGQEFYDHLFEIDHELRPLFKRPMHRQVKKLFSTLNLIVKGLNDLESLIPVVQHMAIMHTSYGVRDSDYNKVGAALLWSLEKNLGKDFNEPTKNAWIAAYTTLSTVMKAAANEAYNNQTH